MNRLAQETSPYLQQHAHNPVDWYPWGEEALETARREDKLILLSIGYSACHWCHVMERESFENEAIARLMNEKFVCIKVDREERPDVDQVYMEAVQTMDIQGGWPLNVFLLPDQRPFYGCTYYPPAQWGRLLQQVAGAFQTQRTELERSAAQLTDVLQRSDLEKYGVTPAEERFTAEWLEGSFQTLVRQFDTKRGGTQGAPKFPMPSIYQFLLRYHYLTGAQEALDHVVLTLREMAYGGIYDQLGGGFARYSVDARWFAPHFEKMLYDNGQLVSLYADAFLVTGDPTFRQVVEATIAFVQRELTSPEGGFYAALDADSEGEEGKFYVWTWEELELALGDDLPLFANFYHATPDGNWEHGYNILFRDQTADAFASANGLDPHSWAAQLAQHEEKLRTLRAKRPRPGLDTKLLAGWNGLMLKGLVDAYRVFRTDAFLQLALRNARFLQTHLTEGPRLYRSYQPGRAMHEGYLEDYAAVIQAYVALYQVTFDDVWLQAARQHTQYVIEHFYDPDDGFFFFSSRQAEALIAPRKELFDNVIPASNSLMARNLYDLSFLLDEPEFRTIVRRQVAHLVPLLERDLRYLSNWASLYTSLASPTAEVAVVGPEALQKSAALERRYHPNKVVAGRVSGNGSDVEMSENSSGYSTATWPLLQNRTAVGGETTFYVCYNQTCQLPVQNVEEAWRQIYDYSGK
ncbi:hypothetical protein SAMN05421823_109223 [Catalinimonas alkaloidigena]|uniref:Spermatogenesis-associated protein 20-like TRX domain-containing protein n=1 Tax=Catalinimonas alkaloidigena TaxID=1075417 RepID=A0A1G9PKV4_9BACT|nr:thioredoxin domain-containing protein [Catalinimonas alkaloidigena]SDL99193.1 hypothetical protein SAMN05421823_109223 [Catalinimonas alkaloidigena]